MRVLLTGASGNLGRGVLRALVAAGHEVLAIGRDSQRLFEVCAPYFNSAKPFTCDLSGPGDLSLPDNYDAVVHAAAHATAQESPDAHVAHNVIATRQLLRHAARRPHRAVVFFSSISVYGCIRQPVVDEQTDIINPGSYGASKLLGEMMLKEYGTTFSSIALRLPGILGPGARDPWLARVLQTARAGQPVSVYTPEAPFNNAVHVDELSAFVGEMLTRVLPGFDVLTLGANEPKPLREVVTRMLSGLGTPIDLREVNAPRTPFCISIEKATKHYGFFPSSVLETVRRFAAVNRAEYELSPTDSAVS